MCDKAPPVNDVNKGKSHREKNARDRVDFADGIDDVPFGQCPALAFLDSNLHQLKGYIAVKKEKKVTLSYSSEGLVSNKTVVKLLQAGGSVGMASVGADFYGAVSGHSISVFILVVGDFNVEFHFFVHDGCNILQMLLGFKENVKAIGYKF